MDIAGLRVRLLTLGAAVAATLVFAAPASAATKPFSLVICALGASETCAPNPGPPPNPNNQPAAVPAGASGVSMTAAFLNENKPGTGINLGSANLTAPSGFTVNSASLSGPGGSPLAACTPSTPSSTSCLNVNGNISIIELRSLSLIPGAVVTLSMTVTTPSTLGACTVTSPCAWGVVAKQSNDFSGAPGNSLNVDNSTSNLKSVLAQAQFTAQPASAAITPTVITDTPYTPSGGAVTVKIVDIDGATLVSYNGQVSVSLNPAMFATTQGTLHGTTSTSATGGVATFSDLSVDSPGNAYSLTAKAADLPPSATSNPFDIAQAGETCDSKQACKQLEAGSANFANTPFGIDVKASATATAGSLALSVDFGNLTGDQCEGYTAQHAEFLNLTEQGTETDTITTTIPSFDSVTNTTIKNQDLCFASKQQFTELNETTQPTSLTFASPTSLPDGSPGFSGLLADCAPPGKKPTGLQVDPTTQPCVVSRSGTSNRLGGGTLSITSSSPIDSYKTG